MTTNDTMTITKTDAAAIADMLNLLQDFIDEGGPQAIAAHAKAMEAMLRQHDDAGDPLDGIAEDDQT